MKLNYLLWFMCFISIAYCHASEIYQYIDQDGNLVVSNLPQNKRLLLRQKVLREELVKEKEALKDINQLIGSYNNNSRYQFSKDDLLDSAALHQKNIDILNKQLGNY